MSTQPRFELKYFDIRGRAEQIRLALAEAGIDFTDVGVQRSEWMQVKGTTPLGQLPVLTEHKEDGKVLVLPQSQSILRHIARTHNLYGSNEEEMSRCDVIADTAADWRWKASPVAFMPNMFRDAALNEKYVKETLPPILDLLEKLLVESPATSPYFVTASHVTFSDLMVFDSLDFHLHVLPSLLQQHPKLHAFYDAVRNRPNISAYLASPKRRQSDHTHVTKLF